MRDNDSTVWGSLLLEALVDSGIETACIVPGSRSTPLVVAAVDHPRLKTISLLDERAAGFFALGRAKRTGDPHLLISTSGTATANFHPAVIEANQSRTPLVVCTADRPAELQECDANQTINQRGIYGDTVRWDPTIPEPRHDARSRAALRATVAQAVASTHGPPAGPVHINVPLRKPLTPGVGGAEPPQPQDGRPTPTVDIGLPHPPVQTARHIATLIDNTDRGLIVCGPLTAGTPNAIRTLATETGYPLLADPLSGFRWGLDNHDSVIGGYDAFLDGCPEHDKPELIIRFGGTPTSVNLIDYLAEHDGHHVLVDPGGRYRDSGFSTTHLIDATPTTFVDAVVPMLSEPGSTTEWTRTFLDLEVRYWELVDDRRDALPTEGRIAHAVIEHVPSAASLFVSNSMPIRDVDRFGRPRSSDICVIGNRGASGIDGILSTGLGAGSIDQTPTVILTGDLAFYHDLTGLLAIERAGIDATIVVINNDGGGIFHALPIEAVDPPFTDYFRTPHGLTFEAVADLYGIGYEHLTPDQFFTDTSHRLNRSGSTIIEIPVNAAENHRDRGAFHRMVHRQLH